MAIYHLTVKVISRARGQSAVAAAAYRSGASLRDQRYGQTHNYSRSPGVAHSEIMAPPGAPAWVHDREVLWNRVEAGERRKDAQLARAIEIGLPVELTDAQSVALMHDFVAQQFVSKGMTADFCIRRNQADNPHAHIMLTLRQPTAEGFGPKMRQWNRKSNLFDWRAAWAERANVHLARAGHDARIDHRTLEAQQSELVPERKTGIGRLRGDDPSLPLHLQNRFAEQRRISKENGDTIIEDPRVAIRELCRQRSIFGHEDLVNFLKTRTEDGAQFESALQAIQESSELVRLAANEEGSVRFTSQDLVDAEKSLLKRVAAMSARRSHSVPLRSHALVLSPVELTPEQRGCVEYLVGEGDLKAIAVGVGSVKIEVLKAAREVWEARGLKVIGVALSRTAADQLSASSGIASQTLEARELALLEGRDTAAPTDLLLVDGAEMIGLKQLERLLAVADKARGKVVLLGDSQQLAAMKSMSPLRDILDRIGATPSP